MGIAEDLNILEERLRQLIISYEQYFIGIEKREPLKLMTEVETLVRRYANKPINNTMHKFRYNTLVARLSTYRQQWNRIVREIEEGRYHRDRNRVKAKGSDVADATGSDTRPKAIDQQDGELDRIYNELITARKNCNMPVEGISREKLAATLDRQRPALTQQLGSDNIRFRVVIENGKPKIKAGNANN